MPTHRPPEAAPPRLARPTRVCCTAASAKHQSRSCSTVRTSTPTNHRTIQPAAATLTEQAARACMWWNGCGWTGFWAGVWQPDGTELHACSRRSSAVTLLQVAPTVLFRHREAAPHSMPVKSSGLGHSRQGDRPAQYAGLGCKGPAERTDQCRQGAAKGAPATPVQVFTLKTGQNVHTDAGHL